MGEKNPYLQIIHSFVQVNTEAPVKKEEIEAMISILSNLYEDLMDTNTNMYQAESERQDNFDKVKERCEEEMANWEQ